jgi:hypothetical protein
LLHGIFVLCGKDRNSFLGNSEQELRNDKGKGFNDVGRQAVSIKKMLASIASLAIEASRLSLNLTIAAR